MWNMQLPRFALDIVMIDPRPADPAETIAAYLEAKAQQFADCARRRGGRGDGMACADTLQVAAADIRAKLFEP
jgi:hypothetical protein